MGWEEGCGWAGGETARGGLGELRMWGWGTVEETRDGWMDGWRFSYFAAWEIVGCGEGVGFLAWKVGLC